MDTVHVASTSSVYSLLKCVTVEKVEFPLRRVLLGWVWLMSIVRSWVPISSVSSPPLVPSVFSSWSEFWIGLWGGLVMGKAVSGFSCRV